MKAAHLLAFFLITGCGGAGKDVSSAKAPKVLAYGAWKSPIRAQDVAAKARKLQSPSVEGDAIYWVEWRPTEKGRRVVVHWTESTGAVDVLPAGFSARTEANGYGGTAYVVAGGIVYFINHSDQRLYAAAPGAAPKAITSAAPRDWFADLVVDRPRRRLIAVRERHPETDSGETAEPANTLVAISLETGEVTELVSGWDFVSSPRISPDGSEIAFVSWSHPNMPWDGSTLWRAPFGDYGAVGMPTKVAGGQRESVTQPRWGGDGSLIFVSDRSQWWNLYQARADGVRALAPRAADFAPPPWGFGMASFAVTSTRLIGSYTENGRWSLAEIGAAGKPSADLASEFTVIGDVAADGDIVAFSASSATQVNSIVRIDLREGKTSIIAKSSEMTLGDDAISQPESIEFPTTDGARAYAFFYPPTNPLMRAPAGTKPPVIVHAHGGPTGQAETSFNLAVQFWTSRGFAVVDVNYRGSSGYGRVYRDALRENWGKSDVEDLAAAARYLVERGDIDARRVAVSGGSAGGFAVLNALIHHPEFAAGASYYGVSDLEALAKDTHKFESRYLDQLIGPYPQEKQRYRQRSPIHHLARLNKPLILFHGLLDKIVPPNQSKLLHRSLTERGVASEIHLYDNEGHGFRHGPNIASSLEAELAFYQRVFALKP